MLSLAGVWSGGTDLPNLALLQAVVEELKAMATNISTTEEIAQVRV